MPSLDGYSLNEKMDKTNEAMKEEIDSLRSRVEKELASFRDQYSQLNDYVQAIKPIMEKKEKKSARKKRV